MLLDQLNADIISSLKSGNQVRTNTLRYLVSGIRNAAISKYGTGWETGITDPDVVDVVRKQVKTHRESIDAFTKANRNDLVDKEKAELDILSAFLPPVMPDNQITEIVREVISDNSGNFGSIMSAVMKKIGNQADGSRVSEIVKQQINRK